MSKTMKQSLEEDTKEFNRIVAQYDRDGTWEKIKKNWGVSSNQPVAASASTSLIQSSFADGDDDGGLWISPSGKVIDTQGISHAEFTANHYNLFGISQADEDSILARAQADEGVMDFDEYLIVFLMEKGWTRIRVNDDYIFIDLPSVRQAKKCLSWAADALINTVGRSPDDVAHIETYQDGHFLTESPATLKSLWSGFSYTPLYSQSRSAIFSMAGGFANADLIMNLKKNLLELLHKTGFQVTWVFDGSVSSEKTSGEELLNWRSTLVINGVQHNIVFVQNGKQGDLVVLVGSKRLFVGRYGAFDAKFLRAFWGALGVHV